jgi:hypothetical protein
MANPVIKEIPINVWTKVATNVKEGAILPLKRISSGGYLQTTRVTGGDAPTDGDEEEGKNIPWDGASIKTKLAIDVYITVTGEIPGRIRVDL